MRVFVSALRMLIASSDDEFRPTHDLDSVIGGRERERHNKSATLCNDEVVITIFFLLRPSTTSSIPFDVNFH